MMFKRQSGIHKKQSGVTLIEVLVTLFVMAIGLLGLAGLQSTAVKDGVDTSRRSQVMWLVSELIERMRANPDGQATGYTVATNGNVCATAPPKRCSNNGAGPAQTDCTANEMAAFDVWEVFCGQIETGVMANATDMLNFESIVISCGGGSCNETSDYTIRVTWLSQSVDNSRLLSADQIDNQRIQNITMVVRP